MGDSRSLRALHAMAYVSIVYGGFLVLLFCTLSYFALWRQEFLPVFPENPARHAVFNDSNLTRVQLPEFNRTGEGFSFNRTEDPLAVVLSLQSIAILLTGVLFLVNGYFLLKYLRRKEHGDVKKFVTSSLLTDEEKAVYEELIKCGGEATQKQLTLNTGFSAVKVYRILKRLEGKKVVKTFPYGMTKKIVLNES